jgi:transcriptional regulator of nitric oxide reductase
LKRLAAAALSLGCAVAAAAPTDRIYTLPDPSAELKRLFPAAAAFSPLAGEPLHFKAYGSDLKLNPAEKPIGVAFWTTDLVPQERGYHGPIHILVGLDMAGVLAGVVVTYDSEPYGYFSVEPPRFAAQFKGKRISDPFRVGGDVDAVSRASITIASAARAIRDSSRMVAKQLLPPEVSKE